MANIHDIINSQPHFNIHTTPAPKTDFKSLHQVT